MSDEKIYYKNIKGETYRSLLDKAFNLITTGQGNHEIINTFLDIFIDMIPDNTDVAIELGKRLTELDNFNDKVTSIFDRRYKEGDPLVKSDISVAKQNHKMDYVFKKYKICKRIYEMYHLYEDSSVVDYEL